jgi:hypothetical protein
VTPQKLLERVEASRGVTILYDQDGINPDESPENIIEVLY